MSKKKIIAGIGCVVLVAAAVTAVLVYTGKGETEASLGDNQRYVYAYVSDIQGNEITYMEMEESVVTAYLESQEEAEEEASSGTDDSGSGGGRTSGGQDGEMPSGDFDGEMPSGDFGGGMSTENSGGEMPSGGFGGEMSTEDADGEMSSGDFGGGMPSGDFDGEMPSGGFDGELSTEDFDGEMPSGGFDGEMAGDGAGMGTEIVTTLIPVGVTVHTSTDTETTFQRLASGDMLKMLVETDEDGEEVIIEIWMLL